MKTLKLYYESYMLLYSCHYRPTPDFLEYRPSYFLPLELLHLSGLLHFSLHFIYIDRFEKELYNT